MVVIGYFQMGRDFLGRIGRDDALTVADFRMMMIALRDSKLPGNSVALGIDYLADGTGLDRSTIIRSRRRLVQLGYLIPGGFGLRGLALFSVATGGVDATPGGADATCRTDATGGTDATGRGGARATGTGGAGATQTETGNITTTTLLSENDGFPTSEGDAKHASNSKPQSAKVTWDGTRIVVPNVFMNSWSESYPAVNLRMSIRRASSWCMSNPGKRPKKDFARFLNAWFRNVKPSDPEYIDSKEQAADDADLIRQAEETFPDPDERADFFHQRSLRGLRVPPGVDCRPMPA